MPSRPVLLFHCQHSLGMGHLIRSMTLAYAFSRDFRVVFLNGGPMPPQIRIPETVEVINLPSLGMALDGALTSREKENTIHQARIRRRQMIAEVFSALKPQVLFIELFPFGRKKFSNELLPLLEMGRRMGDRAPVTLCSLRDILVGGRRDQEIHEIRASLLANHYFDAILVHADENFIRLEETFHSRHPIRIPVFYTGFVMPRFQALPKRDKKNPANDFILVSAGGGIVGAPLFRTAIQAHQLIAKKHNLRMKLIAGPFLPEEDWRYLQAAGERLPGLEVVRFVPNLAGEMRKACLSISQCGYNTSMDILRSGVPAIVVPFSAEGEDEQMRRARRLQQLGVIRLLEPSQLEARRLARMIRATLRANQPRAKLNLNGAEQSVEIVKQLLQQKQPSARLASIGPRSRSQQAQWLDPVRKVLDQRLDRVLFFFRDDDVGWNDRRFLQLLSLFEHFALPLDMAAIPAAMTEALAKKIRVYLQAAPDRLGIHQHGFAHANYELHGRKCEFGPSRSYREMLADIAEGQKRLRDFFGKWLSPIFTPPWNRCTRTAAECLLELGFDLLSRDRTAQPFHLPGLQELPIHIDWFAKKKGERLSRKALAENLAAEIRRGGPVGIMFHHAVMDEEEQAAASELLFLLATHGNAKCRSMKYVAQKLREETASLQNVPGQPAEHV